MSKNGDGIKGWFAGQIPDEWFSGPIEVTMDREEILVVGPLPEPKVEEDATDETKASAARARISRFREDTREARIRIAEEAEERFGRKVSWGATCGEVQKNFTRLAVPVMTRLRMPQRAVLDTLIDAGVARSRSEALAWCVRLVGQHQEEWLSDLRDAMTQVEEVRAAGPDAEFRGRRRHRR